MANVLRDLIVDRVSFVDRAAVRDPENPTEPQRYLFWKSEAGRSVPAPPKENPPMTAIAEAEARAAEIRKSEKYLTIEQARARVYEEEPELFDRVMIEVDPFARPQKAEAAPPAEDSGRDELVRVLKSANADDVAAFLTNFVKGQTTNGEPNRELLGYTRAQRVALLMHEAPELEGRFSEFAERQEIARAEALLEHSGYGTHGAVGPAAACQVDREDGETLGMSLLRMALEKAEIPVEKAAFTTSPPPRGRSERTAAAVSWADELEDQALRERLLNGPLNLLLEAYEAAKGGKPPSK